MKIIRFSFTLSCPQGVPSSGGPFLVLHNCGLDLCPHQRCVHGSLRAKDRHKKYLIKSDVLVVLRSQYCFDKERKKNFTLRQIPCDIARLDCNCTV